MNNCGFTFVSSALATNTPFFIDYSPIVQGTLLTMAGNFNDTTVNVYFANQKTGILTQVPGSPFQTGAVNVGITGVRFSPNGQFAVVANQQDSTVSLFAVNPLAVAPATVFTLIGSPVSTGQPFDLPFGLSWSPNGQNVSVANDDGGNTVSIFSFTPSGLTLLTRVTVLGDPEYVVYSPDGLHAAVSSISIGMITIFSVAPNGAFITPGMSFPLGGGQFTTTLAYSPDGKSLAVINNNSPLPSNVTVFVVNTVTGALSNPRAYPLGSSPIGIAYRPNGACAAVTNSGDNTISLFAVDPVSGNFTQIAGSPISSVGVEPIMIAYAPNGCFAAVAMGGSNNVGVFGVGPNLSIRVVNFPSTVIAGDNLMSTIAVQNVGTFTAFNISVTQTAGGTVSTVTTSPANIAPGATQIFNVVLPISASLSNGSFLTITSTAGDTLGMCVLGNNVITFLVLVQTLANVAITQKCSKKDSFQCVKIFVQNLGLSDAQNVCITTFLPKDLKIISSKQIYGPIAISRKKNKNKHKKQYFIPVLARGLGAIFYLRFYHNHHRQEKVKVFIKSIVTSSTIDPDLTNNEVKCCLLV
jgi:DNA-binding beta-propeller fold protein YncE